MHCPSASSSFCKILTDISLHESISYEPINDRQKQLCEQLKIFENMAAAANVCVDDAFSNFETRKSD